MPTMECAIVVVAFMLSPSSSARVVEEPSLEDLQNVPVVLAQALKRMAHELDGVARWRERSLGLPAPTLSELAATQFPNDGDDLARLVHRLNVTAEAVQRWSSTEQAQVASKLSEAHVRKVAADAEVKRLQHALAMVRQQNTKDAAAPLAKIEELEAEEALLQAALSPPKPTLARATQQPAAMPSTTVAVNRSSASLFGHMAPAMNAQKAAAANIVKTLRGGAAAATTVAVVASNSSTMNRRAAAISTKAPAAKAARKLRGEAAVTSNSSKTSGRFPVSPTTANATTNSRLASIAAEDHALAAIRQKKVGMSKNLFYFLHPEIVPPLPAAVITSTPTPPPGPALSHLLAAEAIMAKVLDERASDGVST